MSDGMEVKQCNDCVNEFMGFCTLKACEYVKAVYEPMVIRVEPAYQPPLKLDKWERYYLYKRPAKRITTSLGWPYL